MLLLGLLLLPLLGMPLTFQINISTWILHDGAVFGLSYSDNLNVSLTCCYELSLTCCYEFS